MVDIRMVVNMAMGDIIITMTVTIGIVGVAVAHGIMMIVREWAVVSVYSLCDWFELGLPLLMFGVLLILSLGSDLVVWLEVLRPGSRIMCRFMACRN